MSRIWSHWVFPPISCRVAVSTLEGVLGSTTAHRHVTTGNGIQNTVPIAGLAGTWTSLHVICNLDVTVAIAPCIAYRASFAMDGAADVWTMSGSTTPCHPHWPELDRGPSVGVRFARGHRREGDIDGRDARHWRYSIHV